MLIKLREVFVRLTGSYLKDVEMIKLKSNPRYALFSM